MSYLKSLPYIPKKKYLALNKDNKITWPDGKDFAFTIFDDTDLSTLENVEPIYSFLNDHGFRTTKSVWPLKGSEIPEVGGITCSDKDYLEWIIKLNILGFEIGYHNATFHTSLRHETITGIEKFFELFGHYPISMANHTGCEESIYWGNYRLSGINEIIYNLLTFFRYNGLFKGHILESKLFWGDICKEKIQYVRNFIFPDINTIKACPMMPYHDPQKPLVNYWFASSEGPEINSFNKCLSEYNQDRLEEEGGACIMYTHFAKGFYENGAINKRFKLLMERISRKNGWFVPVSTLLDYLLNINGHHNITDQERKRIERKWLLHKIKTGQS